MFCTNCRKELDSDNPFCPNCKIDYSSRIKMKPLAKIDNSSHSTKEDKVPEKITTVNTAIGDVSENKKSIINNFGSTSISEKRKRPTKSQKRTVVFIILLALLFWGLGTGGYLITSLVLSNGTEKSVISDSDQKVTSIDKENGVDEQEEDESFSNVDRDEEITEEDNQESADYVLEDAEEDSEAIAVEDYLCSYSSDKKLDMNDFSILLSEHQEDFPGNRSLAQMMVNEIYARKGYIFNAPELNEYFLQYQWYEYIRRNGSCTSDAKVIEKRFSEIETENIKFLLECDKQ